MSKRFRKPDESNKPEATSAVIDADFVDVSSSSADGATGTNDPSIKELMRKVEEANKALEEAKAKKAAEAERSRQAEQEAERRRQEEANKVSKKPNKPADDASKKASSEPCAAVCEAGPGQAYKYRDVKSQRDVLTSDIWAAGQASHGFYTIVWAWYDSDGRIERLLTAEELQKYVPHTAL